MKAVRYHSYGDSDVLVYEEAERPVAGTGQVVVEVAGTAFNLLDAAIREPIAADALPKADVFLGCFSDAAFRAYVPDRAASACWSTLPPPNDVRPSSTSRGHKAMLLFNSM